MNPVIALEGVSKRYTLYPDRGARIRDALWPFGARRGHLHLALDGVGFSVQSGETLGILGVNGSGKSTLLQIIAGVLQPSTGTCRVRGRIAALLELGAGFNPDLTGRENVALHGTIQGFSGADMAERTAQIESFAAIGEFFDQPMRTYSSGMFLRVAFAAAIHVDPDILIVDEALAVGDAKFQEKCYQRFHAFQDSGKTILFVTHDRSAITRHCTRAILLERGRLIEDGDPRHVVNVYSERLAFSAAPPPAGAVGAVGALAAPVTDLAAFHRPAGADRLAAHPLYNPHEFRFGDGRARIIDAMLDHEGRIDPPRIPAGASIDLYVKVAYAADIPQPILGFTLKTLEGVEIFGVCTEWLRDCRVEPAQSGDEKIYRFTLPLWLKAGDWFLDLAVAASMADILDQRRAVLHLHLTDSVIHTGLVRLEPAFADLGPAVLEAP